MKNRRDCFAVLALLLLMLAMSVPVQAATFPTVNSRTTGSAAFATGSVFTTIAYPA